MEYLIGLALFERQWTFDFGALDVHDDVFRPDIVQGTDMRMIQRCDGAGFPLKAFTECCIASCAEVDIDPATLETNIVRFRLRGVPAGQFVEEAHRLGVHMLPSGPNAVRAVFYLDITDSDVERASELVGETLKRRRIWRGSEQPFGVLNQSQEQPWWGSGCLFSMRNWLGRLRA